MQQVGGVGEFQDRQYKHEQNYRADDRFCYDKPSKTADASFYTHISILSTVTVDYIAITEVYQSAAAKLL